MLKVAVDVQHLYRPSHPGDQGSVYHLPNGTTVTEAHATTIYAAGICHELQAHGVPVLTNDPARGVLVGDYWTRCRAAARWEASVYLACHLNAGGGDYAALEMMSGRYDASLCASIARELSNASSKRSARGVLSWRAPLLNRGERGAVCIESFPGPAIILEPFFGDSLSADLLLAPDVLAELGKAIAEGVMVWWSARSPLQSPA